MLRLLMFPILVAFQPIFVEAQTQVQAQAQARLPSRIILTGATIIDANHPTGLKSQTIIISGDSIQSIIPDASYQASRNPDTTISLDGKYVIPGLIDTHVHMATDPSDVDNRPHTLEVLKKMLASGITAVRDMAGDARTLASLSRDAHLAEIQSPDIYYSALMAGPSFFSDPRTHVSTKGGTAGHMPYMQAVTDSTDLITAVAQAKGTGATGIKLYARLDARLTAAIVQAASRQHILVWGHAYLNPAKPSEVVRSGISSISHAPLLIYDQVDSIPKGWKTQPHDSLFWNTQAAKAAPLLQLMLKHHTILDATLITYKQWAAQDSTQRGIYELAKRYTAAAHKAGIPVSAGTDDDQNAFVQEEMKLLVYDAGFSPADAIIAATRNGAAAIGQEKSLGTIEIGKKASLLILTKNPLIDIANIDSVYDVIKLGNLINRQ